MILENPHDYISMIYSIPLRVNRVPNYRSIRVFRVFIELNHELLQYFGVCTYGKIAVNFSVDSIKK